MRTIIQTGARLHLGFLDLNGACGRRFGSIGVALEQPRCTVAAGPAPAGADAPSEPVRAILERLGPHLATRSLVVEVIEAIPPHTGFGAGTQLALAIALAVSRASGHTTSIRDLARRLGRGQRSGIGIAAFESGGLVIDAGHPTAPAGDAAGAAPGGGARGPPVSAGDLPSPIARRVALRARPSPRRAGALRPARAAGVRRPAADGRGAGRADLPAHGYAGCAGRARR